MYTARFCGKRRQSVKEHLQGVAALCSEFASHTGLSNLAYLCGILHDMGKYSDAFQSYIEAKYRAENCGEATDNTAKKVDHGVLGARFLYDLYKSATGYSMLTRDIACEVICYHHGGLPDNVQTDNTVPIITRMAKLNDGDVVCARRSFEADFPDFNLADTFKKAEDELKEVCLKLTDVYFEIGLIIKLLYSYLVDADRYNSYRFKAELKPEAPDDNQDLWRIFDERLQKHLDGFKTDDNASDTEKTVAEWRGRVRTDCENAGQRDTGIYTLTVPTGGGKTFSSLAFALKHSKCRIIYVVPYTTIIEQNAEKIRTALDCKNQLLEFHSNVVNDNKQEDYEILSERFSSPIIFTTTVQFLDALYACGNDNIRRLHSFENAVIIFDEVQKIPTKCMYLFYKALTFLKNVSSTTSVLCTATQPDLGLMYKRVGFETDGELVSDVGGLFKALHRTRIIDKTGKGMSYDELAQLVQSLKAVNKSVLVVLNTIKSSERLYDLLYEDKSFETVLLTTHLCPKHRRAQIEYVKRKLSDGENIVCVSTQLIEAGVDISFDTAVRSLAGLDSAAQTFGRVNRGGTGDVADCYIVRLTEENVQGIEEIREGAVYTSQVLSEYADEPEKFSSDLTSPEAMKSYFARLFAESSGDKFKYIAKNACEPTIYNMLLNENARNARIKGERLCYSYQFASAAENFRVIDSPTTDIIVPYMENDGDISVQNAISVLCNRYESVGAKRAALGSLQGYAVSVFDNLFTTLDRIGAIMRCDIDGIYILDSMYYDIKKGVTTKKNVSCEIY